MSEAKPASESSRAEQRRTPRYAASQRATLTLTGAHPVSCEIADYCAGGMFLRFLHPDIAIGVLARRVGDRADVSFAPQEDARSPSFILNGLIRRLTAEGAGLSFASPQLDALQALQRQRMQTERSRLLALPHSARAEARQAAARFLLHDAVAHSLDLLEYALPDKLANAALAARGIAEHNALLDAPERFAEQRALLRAKLLAELDRRLDAPDSFTTEAIPNTIELALIEETQFEDWLATASEIARLEERFRPQLSDVQVRVSHAFGYRYDHASNPFGPAAIGHGYREILSRQDVAPRARQIAYIAFREALGNTLGLLYAELLALLPAVETPQPQARTPRLASTGSLFAPSAPAADSPRTAPPDLAHAPAGGGTLGRLTQSLLGFFRNPPGSPHAPHTGGEQMEPYVSPVLERLGAEGQLPPLTDSAVAQTAQLFGALFDSVHAEKSLSDGVRPLFRQIEATLMKLALGDPAFLTTPSHPAHKVLNTLDRLSQVATEDGRMLDDRLLRLMNRWTDRINQEAERNPQVFDEASHQLDRVLRPLLAERAARVFRLQELCEGRQHAETVRREVVAELFARYGDDPVPLQVVDLLNGGWRNVLVLDAMRNAGGDAWETLDRTVAWLDRNCPTPPTSDAARRLLSEIDSRLARVCADRAARDRLIDQLASALIDRPADLLGTTLLAARVTEPAPAEPLTEAQQRVARRLQVGDWLEFDEFPAPLNLVWFGEEPPVYVFVNYRGIKKLDLKRAKLLAALGDGRARWAEDQELPLMDRSYGAMIQKMQRDLVWQATHDPETGLLTQGSFFRDLRRHWLRLGDSGTGYLFAAIRCGDSAGERSPQDTVELLRQLAEALRGALPDEALVGRHHETLLWWQLAEHRDNARAKAEALQRFLVDKLLAASTADHVPPLGIGLAWCPDCLDPESMCEVAMRRADIALRDGAGVVEADDTELVQRGSKQPEWSVLIADVIAQERIELMCHPVVASADPGGVPVYFELVLHVPPDGERLVPTGELIAMAELAGRIAELDRLALKKLFAWTRAHPEQLAGLGGFACKLSGATLIAPDFPDFLAAEFATSGLKPAQLVLSVQESTAHEEHNQTLRFMRDMRRMGCRILLDGFGAESASFTWLRSLPVDYLKIDRVLLRDIETSAADEALVRSIVETADYLGIQTVAGYVETLMLSHRLGEIGVTLIQGYAIAEPRLMDDLAQA